MVIHNGSYKPQELYTRQDLYLDSGFRPRTGVPQTLTQP